MAAPQATMPIPTLPPAPSLVAVLLVIKPRAGPARLVFHHPQNPTTAPYPPSSSRRRTSWLGTANDDDDDDDSSDSSSTDTDSGFGGSGSGSGEAGGGGGGGGRDGEGAGGGSELARRAEPDEQDELEEGEGVGDRHGADKESARGRSAQWERLLGYQVEGLEKLLSPPDAFNKRRFEVGTDNLVWLGCPIFIRPDGLWKKRRKKVKKEGKANGWEDAGCLDKGSNQDGGTGPDSEEEADSRENGTDGTESSTARDRAPSLPYVEGFEPGYGHGLISGAPSGVASKAPSETGSDTRSASTAGHEHDMTMFNVVFVLNPPALEYQLRVKEMYDNVVRTFAKALRLEQAKSSYVEKESARILKLKDKAKENKTPMSTLWPHVIHQSSLAKALAIIYNAISCSKIAHVNLDFASDWSFQIPQPISTPCLPTPTSPQMPGLWLTTANLSVDEDDGEVLSEHTALLLLEDTETLIKEVESDSREFAAPLAFFLRNSDPTKSLVKLSAACSISLQDVQYIARRLIYWRRARPIPPLHRRDTYIVSPNADLRALPAATAAYAARFPTLPSLPQILNSLSQSPRPYNFLIPTKAHRPAYMEILAWLMRGGWVTQLRTFAWLRIPPQVKAEVAALIDKEQQVIEEVEKPEDVLTQSDMAIPVHTALANTTRTSEPLLSPSRATALSPTHSSVTPGISATSSHHRGASPAIGSAPSISATSITSPTRPASSTGSTSSGRTTIPLSRGASPRPGASRTSSAGIVPIVTRPSSTAPTSPLAHPAVPAASTAAATITPPKANTAPATTPPPPPPDASPFAPSLIQSPQKARSLEARWISHIGDSFTSEPELRDLWPTLLKYFDGRHALDEIAVRENLKRKTALHWLGILREQGWLVSVRHW
ncbi:nitrogen permease regulator of amino acid transport activity 3-domain-containing protein [Lineolata rhizophorae]|uniref:Nitrogen permease regulator 3 n=1 Tax=Lineolata rhizophorae TaxID=578093 RepID=A0A6A6PAF8_9PEZI|nr:nitrogen permease regulator of amino acid transport activity 3-domain-containing protein [Lineolata rhizophorae]